MPKASGRAEMIVATMDMGTEMGSIADLLNETEADKTPLQKQLDRLTMMIAGIALAISAIATGLPAVVTTCTPWGRAHWRPTARS